MSERVPKMSADSRLFLDGVVAGRSLPPRRWLQERIDYWNDVSNKHAGDSAMQRLCANQVYALEVELAQLPTAIPGPQA